MDNIKYLIGINSISIKIDTVVFIIKNNVIFHLNEIGISAFNNIKKLGTDKKQIDNQIAEVYMLPNQKKLDIPLSIYLKQLSEEYESVSDIKEDDISKLGEILMNDLNK